MKKNIEGSLAVVQLGITLVGVIAAATGGAGAEETFEPILLRWGVPENVSQILAIAIVVIPLTIITIVVGELVPKVFALRNKELVCLTLSPIMEWFAASVKPAVWFLENSVAWIMRIGGRRNADDENKAAIQDLHGAAAFARISRLIGQREEGIIMSASRLSSTSVKKIALPAEHMDMLVTDQDLSEALLAAHQNMHTRYPVTEEKGNAQRIIGYVNFKDIVANQENFAELKQKEYIRYEDMALETKAGRRIEVEFVSNVYLVDGHKVIQCNIRDMTERVRADEKTRQSLVELEQARHALAPMSQREHTAEGLGPWSQSLSLLHPIPQ